LTLHSETYPNCKDLRTFYNLTNKYNYYQTYYEDFCERNKSKDDYEQAPVLLDILLSGCALPFAMSTFPRFTEAMEEDVKTILRIAPNTLKTTYGQLRCRQNISPLDAACVNTAVPFSVIQTLMDHGADLNHKISLNGYPVHIIYDLPDNYRKKVITKMFRKNGFIDDDKEISNDTCLHYN